MKISIASIKKSQLNASKSASTATMEAPVKKQVKNAKPDYSGVPEAEAEAKAIKAAKKSTATTKARSERKVAQKKAVAPNAEPKAAIKPKAEPKAKKEKEPTKKTTPKFQIVHYSEKCIALFGDTKPIKEELKALGGRFNNNLRPFGEESRVPGWVFPKKCEEAIKELIK